MTCPAPVHDLPTWQRVAADQPLLDAAGDCDPTAVHDVARLRRAYPAEDVAVALALTAARRKAAVKFGDRAATLVADPAGVEQATSLRVAAHKARRFTGAGVTGVTDLCCGIGGDAMGLVAAGLEVTAVDRDPVRAWMAGVNAGCPAEVAEVGGGDGTGGGGAPGGGAVHVDPARRDQRGRVFRLADHEPDPATLRKVLDRHPDAAIKLSPAVDLADLGSQLPSPEVEFISEGGRLVQAVAWHGRLAGPSPRTATLLSGETVYALRGEAVDPDGLPVASPLRYLLTVDASVERAGLMHRLGLPVIHPRLGLFTADTLPGADTAVAPWLTGFELRAELPFRPARLGPLQRWLAEHDAGLVEVKTRGRAVDPDHLQPRLRGLGSQPYTVFVLRHGRRLVSYITRRCPARR